MSKKQSKFPKYVKVNGIALARSGRRDYWRAAGAWGITAVMNEQGSPVVGPKQDRRLKHMVGLPLIECTEDEWREDNRGYVK